MSQENLISNLLGNTMTNNHITTNNQVLIIGLIGNSRHGKSTCAKVLSDFFATYNNQVSNYDTIFFQEITFAAPLKSMAAYLLDTHAAFLEMAKDNIINSINPRRLMIGLADAVKKEDPLYFTNRLQNSIVRASEMSSNCIFVVSDIRYAHEIQALLDLPDLLPNKEVVVELMEVSRDQLYLPGTNKLVELLWLLNETLPFRLTYQFSDRLLWLYLKVMRYLFFFKSPSEEIESYKDYSVSSERQVFWLKQYANIVLFNNSDVYDYKTICLTIAEMFFYYFKQEIAENVSE